MARACSSSDLMALDSSNSWAIDVSKRTWAHDTHHLFDFEANASAVTNQSFTVKDSVTENDGDMVPFAATPVASKHGSEKLIQVEWRDGGYYFNRPQNGAVDKSPVQRCWHLIRNSEADAATGHRLAENETIKFGRSLYKVRQLSVHPGVVALGGGHNSICKVDPAAFDHLADTPCRICLTEGSSVEDPLLAACQCRGSIQHVHFGCLKHWVRERLGLANGDAAFEVGGEQDPMSCELCRTPFQTMFQMGGKLLQLVEIDSPFIVLESRSDHQIHVLPLVRGRPLKIGRGHESNMNIYDPSVSRLQASVELVDGSFVLKDHGSRYGTFVKITKPLLLKVGQQSSVQVGRTLWQLSVKKSISPSPASMQPTVDSLPSLSGDEALDTNFSDTLSEYGICGSSEIDYPCPWPTEYLPCD